MREVTRPTTQAHERNKSPFLRKALISLKNMAKNNKNFNFCKYLFNINCPCTRAQASQRVILVRYTRGIALATMNNKINMHEKKTYLYCPLVTSMIDGSIKTLRDT